MYETIVVGYDGTEGGERALERAAALAGTFGSTIIVVVVEQISPTVASPMGIGMGEVPVTAPEPVEQGWLVESQIERARSVLDSRGVAYDVVSPTRQQRGCGDRGPRRRARGRADRGRNERTGSPRATADG